MGDVCINLKHKVYADSCVVTKDKCPKAHKELWGLLGSGEGLVEEVALEPSAKKREDLDSG